MTRKILCLLLLVTFAGPTYAETVQVGFKPDRCYDGDTCWFQIPGYEEAQRVRVYGVDTPELKGRCPQETFVAGVAKRYANRLLVGAKRIELELRGRDRYDRILARVIFDGRDLAQELIKENLGRPYFGGRRKPWCPEVKP